LVLFNNPHLAGYFIVCAVVEAVVSVV